MNLAWFSLRSGFAACWAVLLVVASGVATGDEPSWKPLFDGKTLDGWKITNFGGEGEVTVEDGSIILEYGSSLTGITYDGTFPKTNYEITLEARRLDGTDFFCGMTFPVAESHCSLILGGWGGAVVGLSSIDGHDASENETTQYKKFEAEQWYKIRLRVTPERIEAWIDDKVWVDQDIKGRKITTRSEVNLSKPFGISAYETRSALRKLQIRELAE
ncbi:MAG: DUF1080 domain-containing protein [Planctomycetaceae bacterium]|nr:DUF1080 domain-containing protein [Planctomycetales bacterium]MCB9875343.1 DUF1080 domain-containing protein [Planctomycetaceae bacterium]MCB9936693.1 DUF1080 domain-containing protein [Planctomycetaceae bacterium]HRX79226.1 DUF1080 domain-containing protein [Pirellulaceae bacterium]